MRDSEEDDDAYNSLQGSVAGATKWSAGYSGTYSIKRVAVRGYRQTGATSDTTTIQIWSNSTGPNTKLGESDQVNKSSWPTSADWVVFDFSTGVSVTAGTTYWIAVAQSGTTMSLYWRRDDNAAYGTNSYYKSDNGTTWSAVYDNIRNLFRVYTCD